MPELPEVERGRRLAERAVGGKVLESVRVERDEIVYPENPPEEMVEALTGTRVEAVGRRGKYLWFELDRKPWPLFHFGMTGAFEAKGEESLLLASSRRTPKGEESVWPPRFTKILLIADDGAEVAMTNSRRLGRIRLRDEPREEPPVSDLGFDPLLDLPDAAAFHDLLQGRRAILKGLLLNQGFAAGVGNWIADEVLYQAGIDPRRRADDLTDPEIERVRQALRDVVETAVAVDAEKDHFPDDWLFHRRWGKSESATDAKGNRVEFVQVCGRTTAWVPERQG